MSPTRRLAAIMFTDIVGYTSLMGQNEEVAIKILEENRQLHKSIIEEFDGKRLKEIGDGTLASFNSVSDAVNCAKRIQEICKKKGNISLKIGIHLGEVVFEGDDVFGDGVNVASRIESMTPSDRIYVSESVSRNIANKEGFETVFVGEKSLKNIEYPVRIYEVITKRGESKKVIPQTDREIPNESIAVLPFVNMSNDPEQEYLCDGLTEEILNILAKLDKLKVAARTSAFSYKGQNINISQVGKELNVSHVLEGSVRKSGNRIRITAQLINVQSGYHLWSERYDREIEDIFDIQDEIALAILNELKIVLLGDELASISIRDTDNLDAYQYYLNGRFNFHKFTGEGWLNGINYYNKAIEIVPDYARAHAGRASCFLNLWHFSVLPPDQSFPQMQEETYKALELDDSIAETQLAMARYRLWYDFEIEKAAYHFQETFKDNPNIPDALAHYAFVQCFLGNYELANNTIRKSKELDPFSPMVALDKMVVSWLNKDFDEHLSEGKKTIETHPQFWGGFWYLGVYFWAKGDHINAIDNFEKAFSLFPGHMMQSLLGCLYALTGQVEKSREILIDLKKADEEGHVGSFYFAILHASMNNMDNAFEYLEKAAQERTGHLIFLGYYARDLIPTFNQDSRFKPYLEKVRIPFYEQKNKTA